MKILFAYPFCSFGGCERILLNRAIVLAEKFGNRLCIDFYFKDDHGALGSFDKNLQIVNQEYGVNNHIISSIDENNKKYDMIFVIDYPAFLDICNFFLSETIGKIFIECHSGYVESRQYLKKIHTKQFDSILVPSLTFQDTVMLELDNSVKKRVKLLRNFSLSQNTIKINMLFNKKKPILFYGRSDDLKNPFELIKLFKEFPELSKQFVLMFVGSDGMNIKRNLKRNNLLNKAIVLPAISFEKQALLFSLIINNKGILISPSKAESFGLSVNEAINFGLPSIISNIPAHCEQLNQNKLLYKLGDLAELKNKILEVSENYDYYRSNISKFTYYNQDGFLNDFENLCDGVFDEI